METSVRGNVQRDWSPRPLSWRQERLEITPPTVDEVLDLILSAARGKAPGEDGIRPEVLGAGGRPMAQLLQPLFAGV